MKIVLLLCAGLWAGVLFAAAPAAPTELTADAIYRDRFTARWTNAAATVSNEIEVIKVFPRELEANFVTNYTFDAISNSGKQPKDLSGGNLAAGEPGFSGVKIYAATNAVGVLQVGSSGDEGCLAVPARASYDGLALICVAQSYPNSNENHKLLVSWVKDDITNQLDKVAITDDMAPYAFSLANVVDGAQLLVQSPVKKNGRVLVDSIGFATAYTLPYSQTNEVASTVFPARSHYRVRDLEPQTRYLWRVGGWTAEAAFLGFSAYATVETTDDAAPVTPLVIRLR